MRSRDESAARLVHRGLDVLRVLLVGVLGYLVYVRPGQPSVDLAVDIRAAMGIAAAAYGVLIVAGLSAPALRWWRRLGWAAPALLAADFLLAAMVLVAADPSIAGITWVAFLVPILSAASLYGLLASAAAWLAIAAIYLPIRVDSVRGDSGQELIRAGIEQVTLLAVVGGVAGAVFVYIHQRMRETYLSFGKSQRFSTQLTELSFASRQLRQLTAPSDVLRGTVHDATRLGFADADICERRESRPWTVTHSSRRGERLPVDAELLSNAAVHSRGTVVRSAEEHEENAQDLHLSASRALMATPITIEPGRWLVLRAWMAQDAPEPAAHDRRALESLAAVAADAWRHAEQLRHLAKRSKALAEQARHDGLTGLANRANVLSDLQERLQPEFGHSQPTALLYVDLEGFKEANDAHGHAIGDQALVEVAGRLNSVVPEEHRLGRLGGDEFLIVVDLSTRDDPVRLAEAVCASIAEPIVIDDISLQLGASVGIALAEPDVEAEELVRRADAAVYVSRQAGGGLHMWQDAAAGTGESEAPDWTDGVVVALEPGAAGLPSWAQDLIDAAEAAAQLADAVPDWDAESADGPNDPEATAELAETALDEVGEHEPAGEELVGEEPAGEELVAEELVAEADDELVADKAHVAHEEDVVNEELVAEELVAEELVAEELVAEEPDTDDVEPVAEEGDPADYDELDAVEQNAPHPDPEREPESTDSPHRSLDEAFALLMAPPSDAKNPSEIDSSAHSSDETSLFDQDAPHLQSTPQLQSNGEDGEENDDENEDVADVADVAPPEAETEADPDGFGELVVDHVVSRPADAPPVESAPAGDQPATLAEALLQFDDAEVAELEADPELPDI